MAKPIARTKPAVVRRATRDHSPARRDRREDFIDDNRDRTLFCSSPPDKRNLVGYLLLIYKKQANCSQDLPFFASSRSFSAGFEQV